MIRMTETETLRPSTETRVSGLDARTQTGTETGTGAGRIPTQTRTETETAPVPGPGPTQTPGTETQTQTGTRRGRRSKVIIFRSGPGPIGTKTGTKTGTGVRHWLADGGYLTALTIVVAVVASLGQKMFAVQEHFVRLIVIPGFDVDITPWLAVAAFDLSVAALLHGGIRAARMDQSPWPWWSGAAIVGGLSIYTNTQHPGAWITASASSALLIMWFLRMYGEYAALTRTRRAAAPPKLLTSTLLIVDRKLAYRAWVISTTKPLKAAVAYRRKLGEALTERDIAVLAARLYLQVQADMLYTEMNPHLVLDDNGKPSGKKVRFWQGDRKARAQLLADMTAGDAVDQYMGLPVIDRQGIKPGRVTYAPLEQTPTLGALPPAAPQATPGPQPTPQPTTAPQHQPEPQPQDGPKPQQKPANAPTSPASSNLPTFLTLEQIAAQISAGIDRLPTIDPSIDCECHQTKPCGRKLIDHFQRKGQYVVSVVNTFSDWATRVERIGKADITTATSKTGGGITNEMAGMFDHLRKLVQEQRAAAAA